MRSRAPNGWCCRASAPLRIAAAASMRSSGMVEALDDPVRRQGRPFLGICVGMQLMAERGREYEVTDGLGWIPGEVDRITPSDPGLKIPHMGWNTLDQSARPHPLLAGIPVGPEGLHAYFVHSFISTTADRAEPGGTRPIMAGRVTAIVAATPRRHPVPSREEPAARPALIANFLQWTP